MAFGKPAADAEAPITTRVHLVNVKLSKCNSVAEAADLLESIADDELRGLSVVYGAALPGRSARDLAFLHGVRRAIASEINARKMNVIEATEETLLTR